MSIMGLCVNFVQAVLLLPTHIFDLLFKMCTGMVKNMGTRLPVTTPAARGSHHAT